MNELTDFGLTKDVILLIHGTHASADSVRGERWWQVDSRFWERFSGRLAGRAEVQPEELVFRWSGANSERAREKAGSELLARLLKLEKERRFYHLIAHSHGGSVIWAALRQSVRRNEPLEHLRSWSTLGTPFFIYRPRWSNAFLIFPLLVFLEASFDSAQWWRIIRDIPDAREGSRGSILLVSAVLAFLGLSYLVWQMVTMVVAIGRAFMTRRWNRRALRRYGQRWLGVWSTADEAINGLKNTLDFQARFTPRMPIISDLVTRAGSRWDWSGLRKLSLLAKVSLPVRLALRLPVASLYNLIIAPTIDTFIAGRLADRSQGNDRGSEVLATVTPGPMPGVGFAPLPGPIHRSLIAVANRHAVLAIGHVREALGAVADEGGGFPQVLIGVRGLVGGRELVHSSYFGDEQVRELLALHVESGIKQALDRPAAVAPRADRLNRWLAAARRRIAPAIHDAWSRSPTVAQAPKPPTASLSARLRSAFHQIRTLIVRATPSVLLAVMLGWICLVPSLLLQEFTDEAQIKRLIRETPVAFAASQNEINAVVDWALTLYRRGDDSQALETVRFLRVPFDRSDALMALGDEALKSGDVPAWRQSIRAYASQVANSAGTPLNFTPKARWADGLAFKGHALAALAVSLNRAGDFKAANQDRRDALNAIEQALEIIPPLDRVKGIMLAPAPGDLRLSPASSIEGALALWGERRRIKDLRHSADVLFGQGRPGASGEEGPIFLGTEEVLIASASERALRAIDAESSDSGVRSENYARLARALALRGHSAEAATVAEKVIDAIAITYKTRESARMDQKVMRRVVAILASSHLLDPRSILEMTDSLEVFNRASLLQSIAEMATGPSPADVVRPLAHAAAQAHAASLAPPFVLELSNQFFKHLSRAQGLARLGRLLASMRDPTSLGFSRQAQEAVEAVLEAEQHLDPSIKEVRNFLVIPHLHDLIMAAEILHEAGSSGRSLELADQSRFLVIEYNKQRPEQSAVFLVRLSQLYANLGREADARQMALLALAASKSIDDGLVKSNLTIELAQALARSGLLYQARQACEDSFPTHKLDAHLRIMDEWRTRTDHSSPSQGHGGALSRGGPPRN